MSCYVARAKFGRAKDVGLSLGTLTSVSLKNTHGMQLRHDISMI